MQAKVDVFPDVYIVCFSHFSPRFSTVEKAILAEVEPGAQPHEPKASVGCSAEFYGAVRQRESAEGSHDYSVTSAVSTS